MTTSISSEAHKNSGWEYRPEDLMAFLKIKD